jgi:hypothetical protein
MNQFKLLALKQELLKISVSLQTAFAVETHLAEGKRLEEQENVLKSQLFRVGNRRSNISRTEGKHLEPLKTFIKKKKSIKVTTPVMQRQKI